jgi:polyisoprenoid-binding protein YceI
VTQVTRNPALDHSAAITPGQYLCSQFEYETIKLQIMIRQSILLFLTILLLAGTINAQSKYSTKSFQLTINGTSNVHDWTSKATNVYVAGDFGLNNNNNLEKINIATVKVQTKSLKSTKNSDIMDDRTHSTLKADKFPEITYVFTKVLSIQQSGGETIMNIAGNLTLGGVTKPTDLTIRIKALPNGEFEVKGTRKILMSNYGIKPPSFMLGAMKVGDEVTLTYDVILKKA